MKLIEEAVKEFNKYRSPEANAEIYSGHNPLEVKFSGVFCRACGFHDYLEDFMLILKEKGIEFKILEVKELTDGAILKLRPKKPKKG